METNGVGRSLATRESSFAVVWTGAFYYFCQRAAFLLEEGNEQIDDKLLGR
jgi:hypothetical protein